MTKLPAILFVCLVACQQVKKTSPSPQLTNHQMDSGTSLHTLAQKKYSLDTTYQKYISKDLLTYIDTAHPAWSVPPQDAWQAKAVNKCKNDNSLINYVRGDFDCNGIKDDALIVDDGHNSLTLVAFLSVGGGFKTEQLAELGPPAEKIEFALTLYKPGRYDIVDPDLGPSDSKIVNFKCNAVGIGILNEQNEGSNDVYYWDHDQLRSCLIDK